MKKITIIQSIFFIFLFTTSWGQKNYQPSPENLKNREWFQDAKFGLFIHWGVYSLMASGEWVMHMQEIPYKQYEKLPAFFNPLSFEPAEWVSLVKKAGMKYITITSKHHDGFAMFDSKVSDYDIVDATPYGKDVLKMLKEECDKQGIKLFFYHSQLDWHSTDYFPIGETGQFAGRPQSGDWNKYIDYMNAQLTELLTNYGDIGGIWFDGMWDKPKADWRLDETYSLIHKLQPGALIGSNHHVAPFPGEDFQMFENDLPGENTMGFNQTETISTLPLEMCQTIGRSWGFNIKETKSKSAKQIIQTMVKAAGHGANLLLNVGPMPNGKIQPGHVDILLEIGTWMEKYGEAIYNCRKGSLQPTDWYAATISKDGGIVYIHLLETANRENFLLPAFPGKIKSVTYFDGGGKVKYKETEYGILLNIPKEKQDEIDTIIKIL